MRAKGPYIIMRTHGTNARPKMQPIVASQRFFGGLKSLHCVKTPVTYTEIWRRQNGSSERATQPIRTLLDDLPSQLLISSRASSVRSFVKAWPNSQHGRLPINYVTSRCPFLATPPRRLLHQSAAATEAAAAAASEKHAKQFGIVKLEVGTFSNRRRFDDGRFLPHTLARVRLWASG